MRRELAPVALDGKVLAQGAYALRKNAIHGRLSAGDYAAHP
ncbi:hypothetical protein QF006_002935 [Pantoea agglomerans]|jgi:hypothetical protein|nr:hypothetical protein [Pantoea agglomerans]